MRWPRIYPGGAVDRVKWMVLGLPFPLYLPSTVCRYLLIYLAATVGWVRVITDDHGSIVRVFYTTLFTWVGVVTTPFCVPHPPLEPLSCCNTLRPGNDIYVSCKSRETVERECLYLVPRSPLSSFFTRKAAKGGLSMTSYEASPRCFFI